MTENNPDDQPGEKTPPNPWSAAGSQAPSAPVPAAQPEVSQPVPPQQSAQAGTGEQQVVFGTAANRLGGMNSGQHQVPPQQTVQQPPPGSGTGQYAIPVPPQHPGMRVPVAHQPTRKGAGGIVAGVTVLALIVGGAAGSVGGYLVAEHTSAGTPVTNALDAPKPAKQASTAPAGSVEAVADKVLPSVVQLQVRGRTSAGEGSGFVISNDGLIVTNNHVVADAADGGQITAVFQNGTTSTATVVGRDPTSDVAVVRAQGATGLTPAELGRSDDLKVGQGVVAIGSPYELSGTVTSGIVSSLHRPTRAGGDNGDQATVLDAIQTDAAINPGNSGGPLVNMQGQVVGINSAIYSPSKSGQEAGSVGIGFSIPIDQARRTADEIVKTGKATQTVLGVKVQDSNARGAQISEVTADGAAASSGLVAGDVVTQMDERKIDNSDALVAAVRSHAPGDKVKLVLTGGKTVEVTLGGQPVEPN